MKTYSVILQIIDMYVLWKLNAGDLKHNIQTDKLVYCIYILFEYKTVSEYYITWFKSSGWY